jgi:hypothetical protein
MYMAVGILRLQEGLDYSKVVADEDDLVNGINSIAGGGEKGTIRTRQNSQESLPRNQSFSQMSQGELGTLHYNQHLSKIRWYELLTLKSCCSFSDGFKILG